MQAAGSPGIYANKRLAAGGQPAERKNMAERLILDRGIRQIEVNDAGECITVAVGDTGFRNRFAQLLKYLAGKESEVKEQQEAFAEKYRDEADDPGLDAITEAAELYKNLCDDISHELDKVFGEGCLRKVFPDVESPDIYLITDFLEAVAPVIEKLAKEYNDGISAKYNRNRKGARSK